MQMGIARLQRKRLPHAKPVQIEVRLDRTDARPRESRVAATHVSRQIALVEYDSILGQHASIFALEMFRGGDGPLGF